MSVTLQRKLLRTVNTGHLCDYLNLTTISNKQLLPTSFECPACKKGICTLYEDTDKYTVGPRFHCDSCNVAGDVPELVMLVKKIDGLTAWVSLRENNCINTVKDELDQIIKSYTTHYKPKSDRILQFIADSHKQYKQDTNERYVLHTKLNLTPPDGIKNSWYTRLSKFIGISTKKELKEAFGINYSTYPELLKMDDNILIIPSYKLPGALTGMWVGCDDNWPKSWLYIPCIGTHNIKTVCNAELGACFYSAAKEFSNDFKDNAFAVNDLMFVLRLHARHFQDNSIPLPIICPCENNYGNASQVFNTYHKKNWIFWNPIHTKESFAQASMCNGKISNEDLVEGSDIRWHHLWLNKVINSAKSWDKLLEDETENMSDQQAKHILAYLRLKHWDNVGFVENCKKHNQERLAYLLDVEYPIRTTPCGKSQILEEKNGCWIEQKHGELISDAIIRPEEGYIFENELWYKGHVLFEGEIVPFDLPAKNLTHRGLSLQIEKLLVEYGCGIPKFSPNWTWRLFDIAKRFHTPKGITSMKLLKDSIRMPKKSKRGRKKKEELVEVGQVQELLNKELEKLEHVDDC